MNCPFCNSELHYDYGICPWCYRYLKPVQYGHDPSWYGTLIKEKQKENQEVANKRKVEAIATDAVRIALERIKNNNV